jgi:hypothetical protein
VISTACVDFRRLVIAPVWFQNPAIQLVLLLLRTLIKSMAEIAYLRLLAAHHLRSGNLVQDFGIGLFLKINSLGNHAPAAPIWHEACSYRTQDWTSA